MSDKPLLVLATRNAHKVKEMASVLAHWFEVKGARDFPHLGDVDETGTTFLENAEIKAVAVSQGILAEAFSLADDSGIELDALNGAPGVYSARYGGLPCDDQRNNEKLLADLRAAGALNPEQRTGRYRCVLVLAKAGKTLASFDGSCEGRLIEEYRGQNGFGYDPLFIPAGYDQTFGELPDAVKAKISHRAKALALFLEWLGRNTCFN